MKKRMDFNLSPECHDQLETIISAELAADEANHRPPRSKSAIGEVIIRLGIEQWKALHEAKGQKQGKPIEGASN